MRKSLIIVSIIILNFSLCYASDYYCNGIIVNTNISAELFCKPRLDLIDSIQNSEHNQEAYKYNMRMYQNCLNSYNRARAEMQKGLCQPATKRVYKGSCEETITEYSVSGNVVQSSSTGGNVACMKRKFDSETRKMLESAGIK